MPGLLDWLGLGQQTDPNALAALAQRMNFDPSTIQGSLIGALGQQQGGGLAPSSFGVSAPQPAAQVQSTSFFGAQPQGFGAIKPSMGPAGQPDMPASNAMPAMGQGTPPSAVPAPSGGTLGSILGNSASALPTFAANPVPGGLFQAIASMPNDPGAANAPAASPPVDPSDPPVTLPGFKGTWTRASAAATEADDSPEVPDVKAAQAAAAVAKPPPAAPAPLPSTGLLAAPADIRPTAQGGAAPATSAQPGFLDRLGPALNGLGNVYGHGGPFDALINLGVGMSSGPGGIQRALSMTQNQAQSAINNSVQQGQLALQAAKLQRDQQSVAGSASFIQQQYAAKGTPISDAQALALAQNSGAVSTAVSNSIKSPDQEKADKAQLVTVKLPDGTEQQQWVVPGSATGTAVGAALPPKPPGAVQDLQYAQANWKANGFPDPSDPKNAGWWSDFARQKLAGGGVNITMPPAEKASEAAYGKSEGDEFGNILKAGQSARATQGQIALMGDAFSQGGGQISTGPFAKSILGAKQAILNTTGIDLGGIPESEAVQKLGFGLATNLTKEITQRPAQQEFLKALENVPGIFMSPQGSKVMMSVLNQQAQQKIDLARLVSTPQNRQNWPDVEQAYYDAHPLTSPFSGKPLTAGDVSTLATAAQRNGIDPTTGLPPVTGGSPSAPSAPAAPSWSIVGN